eukprot:7927768-Alexandrium_andersonii.AAC.1
MQADQGCPDRVRALTTVRLDLGHYLGDQLRLVAPALVLQRDLEGARRLRVEQLLAESSPEPQSVFGRARAEPDLELQLLQLLLALDDRLA